MGSLTRCRSPTTRRVRARCCARYRDAFSQGYREAHSPLTAVNDIKVIEGLSAERPLSADFHRRTDDTDGSIGLKVWSCGRPIPLSERVPILENMGFRVVDEQTHHIQPTAIPSPTSGCTTWCWSDATGGRRRSARQQAPAGSRVPGGDDRRRRERRLQRARAGRGARLARRCADPHHLAVPAPDPRALFAGLHVGDADASTRRSRRRSCSSSMCGSIRGWSRCRRRALDARGRDRRRHRGGAGEGREPRRGPHPAPLRQRGAGGAAHQLLPGRYRWPAEGADRHQVREPQARRPCRCRGRSTRFSSIRRGSRACTCASARWRAAASAGPTGRRISAPRSSGW